MQGGEYQVAGQGRLDGDLRRLEITGFSDHDDIRVLPENGTQAVGEGQVYSRVDLDLDDSF